MSVFQAVNSMTPIAVQETQSASKLGEEMTPTTPRPNTFQAPHQERYDEPRQIDESSVKTPTRDSFAGMAAQRPLPSTPLTSSSQQVLAPPPPTSAPAQEENKRVASSHRPTRSVGSIVDMDVDEDDDETQMGDSDNDSEGSDSRPTKKKKKGQKFFCTEYPPCNLSFTRSEHLARHIRKHTGERPFQCHCSRRFSRLDNLRQHAQTVHINEDIPGDSLAATGTRFQRQIRTDRVRPASSRSRASTMGSSGSHSRGHSRNLSTSSIASTASTFSTMSQHDDFRNRPAQLSMASTPSADNTSRSRLTLDTFNPHLLGGSPGPTLYNQTDTRSHSGYNTSPSATAYSSTNASPRFAALQSPVASTPRQAFVPLAASHVRRLSVPTSAGLNPFQPPFGMTGFPQQQQQPPPSFAAAQPNAQAMAQSVNHVSPTNSNLPNTGAHRDSAAEADWRRRTWHPSTFTGIGQHRPAISGLSHYQAPEPLPSSQTSSQPSQGLRLPGIESFDHAPPVPALPKRVGSPMRIDTPQHGQGELQSGIRRLDIAGREPRHGHSRSNSGHVAPPLPPQHGRGQQLPNPRDIQAGGQPTMVPPQPYQVIPSSAPRPQSQVPPHQIADSQPTTVVGMAAPTDEPATPDPGKYHGLINAPPSGPRGGMNQPTFSQYVNYSSVHTTSSYSFAPVQTPAHHKVGASFTTPRISPEDSGSSEGIPTPASSNPSEWNPAGTRVHGAAEPRPLPAPVVAVEDNFRSVKHSSHRPDLSNWSLQRAQTESRKREREEDERPTAGLRDSGVDIGQFDMAPLGGRADMRRLEALVAVATGEQRA